MQLGGRPVEPLGVGQDEMSEAVMHQEGGRQIPTDGRHLGATAVQPGMKAEGAGCCWASRLEGRLPCSRVPGRGFCSHLPLFKSSTPRFVSLQGPGSNSCCFCPQRCFCPHLHLPFSCCPVSAFHIQQRRFGRRQQAEQWVRDWGRSWRWRPQQCHVHPL